MSTKTESRLAHGKSGSVQTHGNYIGGRWQKEKCGETFASYNPADDTDLIAHFALSGPEDVKAAVDAAEKALPEWRRTPAPFRAELLARAGRLLETRKEEIARAMTREMGKVIKE